MYKKAAPFQSETRARQTVRQGTNPELPPSNYDEEFAGKMKTLIARLESQLKHGLEANQISKGVELPIFLQCWQESALQKHRFFPTFPLLAQPLFSKLARQNCIRKGKGGIWIVNAPLE